MPTSDLEFYELQKRAMAAKTYVGRHINYDGRSPGDLYLSPLRPAGQPLIPTPFRIYQTPDEISELLAIIEKANWRGDFGGAAPSAAVLQTLEPGLKLFRPRKSA
jgi:hypothetical protein